MSLSADLISQFVKLTKKEDTSPKETTVLGETVEYEGNIYVKLDGSDQLTPISTTADTLPGERVTVLIKNHTAIVTGNISSPSARTDTVKELGNQISAFEIVIADKVSTKEFDAEKGRIDNLVTDNVAIKETLSANNAVIAELKAENVEIEGKLTARDAEIETLKTTKLDAEIADLTYATIGGLEAVAGDFHALESTYAEFEQATIERMEVVEGSVKNLDATYATIDFSNIGEAAIEHFYATSGLIEDLVVSEGTITGNLVGVTIKGDLIEGGTIVADKLVVKGEDGLYYKLNTDGVTTESEQTEYNSLNGSVITAKSITATKISVDDLVAFDATIGGFNITDTSLYSGVKETIDNPLRGIYLDNEGQLSFGDDTNYLKYYRDEEGNYKLEISAESILFGSSSKSSAADLKALTEHVHIGVYENLETGDEEPCVELSEGDSDFKMRLTNTSAIFMDGAAERTKVSKDGMETDNLTAKSEFRQTDNVNNGEFVWTVRPNGNYGLMWRGVNS